MRVFVYELISAGGLGLDVACSLRTEGWAMLAAIVEDLNGVANIETRTLLKCSGQPTLGKVCRRVEPWEERAAFQEMTAQVDAVLLIAPEFDQHLADRSRLVVAAGKPLLGSTPEAVHLTGDKLALAQHFTRHGIQAPPTCTLTKNDSGHAYPALCKPRFGAGSQATFLVHEQANLATSLAQARAELPNAELLLQPFVPGQPASVTLLVGPRQTLALQPATQKLSTDGRFHYLGGTLPLAQPLAARAVALGHLVVEVVPGLGGFVGVDLVLGDAADGSGDYVIEINPRPTTSYIGLRRLALDNLAEAMLRIVRGERVGALRWRAGPIEFSAAGMDS